MKHLILPLSLIICGCAGTNLGQPASNLNLPSGTSFYLPIPGDVSVQVGNNASLAAGAAMTLTANSGITLMPGTAGQTLIYGTSAQVITDQGLQLVATAPPPACAPQNQGLFYYLQGSLGVADHVQVCMKDETDNFNWVTIK